MPVSITLTRLPGCKSPTLHGAELQAGLQSYVGTSIAIPTLSTHSSSRMLGGRFGYDKLYLQSDEQLLILGVSKIGERNKILEAVYYQGLL